MAKKPLEWSVVIATNWGRYKKLIPAFLGVALLITLKYLDIELPGFTSIVIDWLVGGATVFGVYQVKNEPVKSNVEITTTVETNKKPEPKGN
jgi:hypothetical protein